MKNLFVHSVPVYFLGAICALLPLSGCSEYASQQQLQKVQNTVQAVQQEQQQVIQQANRALKGFDGRVAGMEARQAATETAFVQMGKGFNVLTESVSEAYNASEKVASKQRRHEREARKLLARATPRLPEVSDIVWLLGQPLSFSKLPQKEKLWLQLTQQGNTLYTDFGNLSLHSETVGNRLYGIPDTADEASFCLELLEGDPDSGAFTAATCGAPLNLYSFVTTAAPPFAR